MAGPAYPIRCGSRDNLALHVGVAQAPPGSVLVADATDQPEHGYWGEILTVAAQARGIAGLVIDGSVRDVARLAALGFPVFATGVAAAGTRKEKGGTAGLPVSVGGAPVQPGDWVVGDLDGVVVVPAADLDAVLARAEERVAWEAGAIDAIRAGTTTVRLFGLAADQVEVVR